MSKVNAFIKDLMPGRSETEVQEAEEYFQEYLLVVRGIAERLEREGKEAPVFEEDDTPQVTA